MARLTAAISTARTALNELALANPQDVPAAIDAILEPVEAGWDGLGELDPE